MLDGFTTALTCRVLSGTGRRVHSPSGLNGRGAPAVIPKVSIVATKGTNRTMAVALFVVFARPSGGCLHNGAKNRRKRKPTRPPKGDTTSSKHRQNMRHRCKRSAC